MPDNDGSPLFPAYCRFRNTTTTVVFPRRRYVPASAASSSVGSESITSRRVRRAAMLAPDDNPGFDPAFERTLELIYREEHGHLPDDLDEREFRSAVAERVSELFE